MIITKKNYNPCHFSFTLQQKQASNRLATKTSNKNRQAYNTPQNDSTKEVATSSIKSLFHYKLINLELLFTIPNDLQNRIIEKKTNLIFITTIYSSKSIECQQLMKKQTEAKLQPKKHLLKTIQLQDNFPNIFFIIFLQILHLQTAKNTFF